MREGSSALVLSQSLTPWEMLSSVAIPVVVNDATSMRSTMRVSCLTQADCKGHPLVEHFVRLITSTGRYAVCRCGRALASRKVRSGPQLTARSLSYGLQRHLQRRLQDCVPTWTVPAEGLDWAVIETRVRSAASAGMGSAVDLSETLLAERNGGGMLSIKRLERAAGVAVLAKSGIARNAGVGVFCDLRSLMVEQHFVCTQRRRCLRLVSRTN